MQSTGRLMIGALGERLAADHLATNGYRIVDRNFRTRYGELDLVAADSRSIVFCEVKTRVAGRKGGPLGPLDGIGSRKRRRVRMMAKQWLAGSAADARRPAPPLLRFDAIGIVLNASGDLLSLEHVEDAF